MPTGTEVRICGAEPQGRARRRTGFGPRGGSGAGRDEKPGHVGPGARATGSNGGRVGSGQPGATPTGERERRSHGATRGFRFAGSACKRGFGSPGQRERRRDVATAPGNRWTGSHAASPAEPSGTTGDVNRSSERLTPAGRSVVDRPTFGSPRVGALAQAGRTSRGAHRFRRGPHDGGAGRHR
jgi:hypothetical protein